MGKRTRVVFISGLVFIFAAFLMKPVTLILFGLEENGVVIDMHYRYLTPLGCGYPVVMYYYKGEECRFKSSLDVNQNFSKGDMVKVLFLPQLNHVSEINNFFALFSYALIGVPLSLFVWIAFWTSFSQYFDNTSGKTQRKKAQDY